MSTSNPLDGYEPRSWSTYTITTEEGFSLPTQSTENEFIQITSESPMALKMAEEEDYDASTMFFYDFEQIVAKHNVYGVGPLMALRGEYEDHPIGKLCFVSFEGMENDPPNYTFYVQN